MVPDFVFLLQQARNKFNSQMRNSPAKVQPHVMTAAPPQSVVIPGQEPLTATMLAAAPPQEQKQVSKEAPRLWTGSTFSVHFLATIPVGHFNPCIQNQWAFGDFEWAFERQHILVHIMQLSAEVQRHPVQQLRNQWHVFF